jgi:hypothetical protein
VGASLPYQLLQEVKKHADEHSMFGMIGALATVCEQHASDAKRPQDEHFWTEWKRGLDALRHKMEKKYPAQQESPRN